MDVFDAHFHIFDPTHRLRSNQGYLPPPFTVEDYLAAVKDLGIRGGAVVAASFQGKEPAPILDALERLGPPFVGVVDVEDVTSETELRALDARGVRGLRFNFVRGEGASISHIETIARRVYDLFGWHAELYIGADLLQDFEDRVRRLPAVSVDHLALTAAALPCLLRLAEQGVRVKASGFGRVDFDVATAISLLYEANSSSLMFGTDLPSTRSTRPFRRSDVDLITETLGPEGARRVLWENAASFYRVD